MSLSQLQTQGRTICPVFRLGVSSWFSVTGHSMVSYEIDRKCSVGIALVNTCVFDRIVLHECQCQRVFGTTVQLRRRMLARGQRHIVHLPMGTVICCTKY